MKRNCRYFGDILERDMECPIKRARYWTFSQNLITNLKKKNSYLRCKIHRHTKKINSLTSLLKDLQEKFKLSLESSDVLKVFLMCMHDMSNYYFFYFGQFY